MAALFFLFSLSSFYFCFLFPLFFLFLSSVSLSSIMTPLFILPLLSFSSLSSSLSPLLPPLFFCLASLPLLSFSLLFPLSHSIFRLSSLFLIFSLYLHTLPLSLLSALSKYFAFLLGLCVCWELGVGGGGKNSLERMFFCEWVTQMEHLSTWKKTKLN